MAKLLIVEDNPEMVKLYEMIFTDYETCVFTDIPEALVYLDKNTPDLAILDFHLPSGSGMEILRHMRSQTRLEKVPALGVSMDDDVKYEAKQSGLNAFLIKPIEIRELRDTIEWLITGVRKLPVWMIQPQQCQESASIPQENVFVLEREPSPPEGVEADPTLRRSQIGLIPQIQIAAIADTPANRGRLGRLIGKLRGV